MANKIKFTPEQLSELQSFFQNNDFTANMTLSRKCNLKGEQAEIFVRTKKIFGEYWLGNLRPLGVNRKMKNFSKDYITGSPYISKNRSICSFSLSEAE